MDFVIIVEGKNDRARLKRLLVDDVLIFCTYGTLSTKKLDAIKKKTGLRHVYLFMDNDDSGKRIRSVLRDAFPDAEHLYTHRGYAGVEGTPDEYIVQQLIKAGLELYLVKPPFSSIHEL